MVELTNKTEETTFLAVRDEYRAVYIDLVKSFHPIRMDAEIGSQRPLNCTAVGKILLAYGPPQVIYEASEAGAFVKSTKNSITDPKTLEKALEGVREKGYAIDEEEYNAEAICVAAPIFGPAGQVHAAVTASGPSTRMRPRFDDIIDLVKDCASEISIKMGY
jgi:DNA-binding IclR family transcriptional regulator